jgi:indole-3-acetaldehyde oxidase
VEVDVLTGATTILRSDLVYDCGQSLNPAVDLGQVSFETTACWIHIIVWMNYGGSFFTQVEGAFVQGVGFFTNEEYTTNSDGLVINDGTWTYKIPTVDTIPKQLNVELFNSSRNQKHVLSSKGETCDLSSMVPSSELCNSELANDCCNCNLDIV